MKYIEKEGGDVVKLTLDTYLQAVGVTRYQLSKQAEINYQIIDNYYKNKVVRYDSDVLDRICSALHCRIEDILSFEEN
ncbi:MAG: helix-turn-helix transcriptional regulator [Clostridia bacterium]|nr:helix-turn-helix transcriptional regulator [Clostridia bacterium]